MKRKALLSIFASLFLCFSGCYNRNLFAWAYDKGSGDYTALMIDAEDAMKKENFSEAAQYYKKALNKKPGDSAAIYGYSSALFTSVSKSSFEEILFTVISKKASPNENLLNFLNLREAQEIKDALDKILSPDMLPSISEIAENKVDVNLNLAISYLLYAAVLILTAPNFAPYSEIVGINGDFSITLPPASLADETIKNAVYQYIIPNIIKSEEALTSISSEGGSITEKVIKGILLLKTQLSYLGYS